MKIRYLVSVLIMILAKEFTACAQDFRHGFIIKNNNDSIGGLIQYRKAAASYDFCFFKKDKNSAEEKLGPTDLKAYGYIDDRRYETKSLKLNGKQTKVFAEVLVKGKASLYLNDITYYFEKDSLIELPINKRITVETEKGSYTRESKKYVGVLNLQIADCNLNANSVKYNQRNLTDLVLKYNECKGSKGIVYKKNIPWVKINPQVFAGFSSSSIRVSGFSNDPFKASNTIVGGGSFDFSSPRTNSKFFFSVEGWYVKNLFQGYKEGLKVGYRSREDFIIDVSYLKIPLGIRFNLLKDNQTPYLKFGVVKYFELKSSSKRIAEMEVNNVVTTSLVQQGLDSRHIQGFWLGVGYTQMILNNLKIFTELRYEYVSGYFNATTIDSNMSMSSLNILFGLRF